MIPELVSTSPSQRRYRNSSRWEKNKMLFDHPNVFAGRSRQNIVSTNDIRPTLSLWTPSSRSVSTCPAEDSTFALAHYRLAVAAGWAERHALSSEAVARALATSERLADRDRRLLTAYAAFRRGSPDDAERQYRAILEDYPDDLEAEFQLADVMHQYNPLRGRPRGEARELFDRVLALDPGFL